MVLKEEINKFKNTFIENIFNKGKEDERKEYKKYIFLTDNGIGIKMNDGSYITNNKTLFLAKNYYELLYKLINWFEDKGYDILEKELYPLALREETRYPKYKEENTDIEEFVEYFMNDYFLQHETRIYGQHIWFEEITQEI